VEAAFQHYFADVLQSLGTLHCTGREDRFHVDLEAKCQAVRGKSKFLDICCSFEGLGSRRSSCAIELKFKKWSQGAESHSRIELFRDIEALEHACQTSFSFGRMFMITDNKHYVRASSRGVGLQFPCHDGAQVAAGKFNAPHCKGYEATFVTLANSYAFQWEQTEKWYFLDLTIPRSRRRRDCVSSSS